MLARNFFKTKNKDEVGQIVDEVQSILSSKTSEEALKFLFELDNRLYQLQGQKSILYGDGIHTKHKHINYHKFFTDNVQKGESVLDIGSSKGELIADIADQVNPGKVVGIEIEEWSHELSKRTYQKPNLEFVLGDATKDDALPQAQFDVITLSNVLEHIEHRPQLLRKLNERYHPKRFLIRVPLFERDWRVPLKKELGMDFRLDDTHFIEYTQEIFVTEMAEAGLEVDQMQVRWGEIWAVVKPK